MEDLAPTIKLVMKNFCQALSNEVLKKIKLGMTPTEIQIPRLTYDALNHYFDRHFYETSGMGFSIQPNKELNLLGVLIVPGDIDAKWILA